MIQLSKRTQLILFTIPLLLSCQLSNLVGSNLTENPPAEQEEEVQTAQLTETVVEPTAVSEIAPTPTVEQEVKTPPALPPSNIIKEETETSGSIVFSSPAGYELTHFADWFVVDYFGQTIVTNSETALEEGGALVDQPLLLIASGDTDGQTAPGILSAVQRELLTQGQLAPVSPVTPLNRPSGNGVTTKQRIVLPEGNINVTTEVLINGDLYTVAIGMLPEGTSQIEQDSLMLMMESLTLVNSAFVLNKGAYGLTDSGMGTLNQTLFQMRPVPESSQELAFGLTQASVVPSGGTVLSFTLEEASTVNVSVIPAQASFDLTVDLLSENNSSLLAGSSVLDDAGAGAAEKIENISLEPGSYRLLVRGYALTGGSFTVELTN